MARRKKKNYANTSMIKQKMDRAHKIFLEKRGHITNTELAEIVGTTRQTIAKHRADGKWDVELEQLRQEVSTSLTGKIIAATVDAFDPLYKDAVDNLKGLNTIIRLKLFKRNNAGEILRNMDGTPQINDALRPKDIAQLVRASSEFVKTIRLISGQSTDNVASNTQVNGKVEHEHRVEDYPGADRIVKKAGAGDEDAQKLLMDYAEIFQKFSQDSE